MDFDWELLHFIHKNASIGVGTIPCTLALPQSRAMGPALQNQLKEYRAIAAQSQAYAKSHQHHLRSPGSFSLIRSVFTLKLKVLLDPSTSKLAEQIIHASITDVVQITRRLHQQTNRTDPILLELGRRLLAAEERYLQEMKRFL